MVLVSYVLFGHIQLHMIACHILTINY